jgi:hypothetical protein
MLWVFCSIEHHKNGVQQVVESLVLVCVDENPYVEKEPSLGSPNIIYLMAWMMAAVGWQYRRLFP